MPVWNLCCVKDVKPELLDNPRLFRNKGSKRKKKKRLRVKFRFPAGEKKTLKPELRRRSADGVGVLPLQYAQTCWGRNSSTWCHFQRTPRAERIAARTGESLCLRDDLRDQKKEMKAAGARFPHLGAAPQERAQRPARCGRASGTQIRGCKDKSASGSPSPAER